MGRPSTPGPGEGGDASEKGKAASALWMVLIGIVSLVLGIISVSAQHWGYFELKGTRSQYEGGSGYYDPFGKVCVKSGSQYANYCLPGSSSNFIVQVYTTIGGICAIVAVAATALFVIFSGLHCAMLTSNKHIMFKFNKNIFFALISIVLADIGGLLAVILGGLQFFIHGNGNQYDASMGPCYILQIVMLLLNVLLVILSFVAYKKAKRLTFPLPRAPYQITADRYESGPDLIGGIAVTAGSGNHYNGQQAPAPLHLSNLPQYPAPASNGQPYLSYNQQQPPMQYGQPAAGNGYTTGYPAPSGHHQGYNLTGQIAQPQVQPRPSPSVNLNPGGSRPGGGVSYNHGIHGSMDSLNSTQSSNLSIGSTGSYSSNGSCMDGWCSLDMVNGRKHAISNPLRSSLKKTKNKDNPSVHSGLSKKSVTIAIGTEQTAV